MRRNHNIYPVTEIIPVSKLKILLAGDEDFLIVKRTEKEILVTGLRNYLKGLGRKKEHLDDRLLPRKP